MTAESAIAAPMSSSGLVPQPNSLAHSRLPEGLTRPRSSARADARYPRPLPPQHAASTLPGRRSTRLMSASSYCAGKRMSRSAADWLGHKFISCVSLFRARMSLQLPACCGAGAARG